jgi:hypothetical protein
MRAPHVALAVVVIGLLATVWLPFVNGPHLWLGIPSLMLWTIIWVLLLSAALAWLEYGTPHPEDDAEGEDDAAQHEGAGAA